MSVQLALLDPTPMWKISEETREVGRKGLAQARAALQGVPRRIYDDGHHLDAVPHLDGAHHDSAPGHGGPTPAPDAVQHGAALRDAAPVLPLLTTTVVHQPAA